MHRKLHWLDRAYLAWVNLRAAPRERRRWRSAKDRSGLRVYYGFETLHHDRSRSIGGMLKSMDLAGELPNDPHHPNLLYLVSSTLPPQAPRLITEAKRAGAIFVFNQNGVAYPGWYGPGWQTVNRPLRFAHTQADYVIYQSAFCRQAAERFLGRCSGLSEILYNPVDTHHFVPQPKAVYDPRLLLLAGSHQAFDRIQSAIDTLVCLRRKHVPARLRIAGRCLWRSDEAVAQEDIRYYTTECGIADAVELSGPYPPEEAPVLLNSAALLLHTKVNDACPRLVVEAMACGLPVVYSATGGTPELVGDEGGVGVPAPLDWEHIRPPDPKALAEAVVRVLSNRNVFATAARRSAVERFDVRPWLNRHQALFAELLMRKRQ